MKCNAFCLCGVAMIAAAVAAGSLALAGEPTKPTKDAPKSGADAAKNVLGAEDAAMMQRWMEYATPGEGHKTLAHWAGEWNLAITMWMTPGAPPVKNTSTASTKVVMDGRYVVEKVQGMFDMGDGTPPAPFEGMAVMGYDNFKKKFFSTWIDNMGTGMMEEWGTCDAAGKVLTLEGKTYDPMIGSERASKSIATIIDADTRKLEMLVPGPDGKMFKHMEITYTRKK